jgi:uncharacterized spore protein YtfJ
MNEYMPVEESMVTSIEPIEEMLERLDVTAVFGEPYTEGNVTVIPIAEIGVGFAYGSGYGQGPAPVEGGEPGSSVTAGGGGGGGGGGGRAVPRGFIRITDNNVSYEPIMDQSRIAMAGILMAAWNVFWISLTIRAFAKRKNK